MNQQSILKVDKLTKKYGDFIAVDNLSIHVKKGEIYGFIGPNGAGKSTTIECILGLKQYDGGFITLLNNNNRKELFNQIGVQFQSTQFHDHIRVAEACELFSSLYDTTQDYKLLIKRFGLEGKENQLVKSLSGGERQKLSVLLALINQPEMVFLDELTTGMDPQSRREVWQILKDLNNEGLTIFLTSHYMDEVAKLCNRITIIAHGKEVITNETAAVVEASQCSNLEDAYLHFIGKEA